jgi:hypothetical protein
VVAANIETRPAIREHHSSLVGEMLFCIPEWVILHASPVYWGSEVTRGNGEPVIFVPGFAAPDGSMATAFWWSRRMGYKPYVSSIGINLNCPDETRDRLIEKIRQAIRETHKAVTIVGHSWGGTIAREAARLVPEGVVRLVITLGSPMSPELRISGVLNAAKEANRQHLVRRPQRHSECYTTECGCPFIRGLTEQAILQFRLVNVSALGDSVVHQEDTVHPDADRVVTVPGTHTGLPWNPLVYTVLGEELATGRKDLVN